MNDKNDPRATLIDISRSLVFELIETDGVIIKFTIIQ